jgi:hypothetical protein
MRILLAVLVTALVCAATAGAAALIDSSDVKNNSLRSVDVKNNSLRSVDVKNNSLRSADVKNRTLKCKDLRGKLCALAKDGGKQGTRGPKGDRGPAGPAGPQGPAGKAAETPVTNLNGPFEATNPTVSLTPDGVEFGPYADGGTEGGSVYYSGLNGKPLSAVKSLVYYARYVSTGDSGGVGVPYLRIFTADTADGGTEEQSSIFSPNTQSPDPDIEEGPFHEWVATSGSWRYNDDAGTGPDVPFATIVADHGSEIISGIYISTGFSNGDDLASLLRWMEVNGQRFAFRG